MTQSDDRLMDTDSGALATAINAARRVIDMEIEGLRALSAALDRAFDRAIDLLISVEIGRAHV